MNDPVLKRILEKSIMRELAAFENDDTPEHKFSLKHRIAMKRIFARYERNVRKLRENELAKAPVITEYKPKLSLKQRLIIVAVIIFLMTFLVGWVVVFVSEKFHGTVYRDNTHIFAVDLENAPLIIENKYHLNSVPEGFELIETDSSPTDLYSLYMNETTKQTIALHQCVKQYYKTHINTEHHALEEIFINGNKGLFIDLSSKTCDYSIVMWDNGDYIIEISANLNKEDTINLSKITKF